MQIILVLSLVLLWAGTQRGVDVVDTVRKLHYLIDWSWKNQEDLKDLRKEYLERFDSRDPRTAKLRDILDLEIPPVKTRFDLGYRNAVAKYMVDIKEEMQRCNITEDQTLGQLANKARRVIKLPVVEGSMLAEEAVFILSIGLVFPLWYLACMCMAIRSLAVESMDRSGRDLILLHKSPVARVLSIAWLCLPLAMFSIVVYMEFSWKAFQHWQNYGSWWEAKMLIPAAGLIVFTILSLKESSRARREFLRD
jgi:hypothetical protein